MGETMPQLDISCHQMKSLMPGMGYTYTSCWLQGAHGNPQTTKAIAEANGYSPKTASNALLLKMTPM